MMRKNRHFCDVILHVSTTPWHSAIAAWCLHDPSVGSDLKCSEDHFIQDVTPWIYRKIPILLILPLLPSVGQNIGYAMMYARLHGVTFSNLQYLFLLHTVLFELNFVHTGKYFMLIKRFQAKT
jgi:hypothetical protein